MVKPIAVLAMLAFAAAPDFRPAVFAGFTVGKVTVRDIESRFGKPAKKVRGTSNDLWLYYSDIGPVPGRLEIIASSSTDVIDTIVLYPSKLTVSEAVRLFGRRYRIVRFDFDLCLSDGDSAPMFESPQGVAERLIYDGNGLAVERDEGLVKSIQYLSRPYGARKSKCNKQQAK